MATGAELAKDCPKGGAPGPSGAWPMPPLDRYARERCPVVPLGRHWWPLTLPV